MQSTFIIAVFFCVTAVQSLMAAPPCKTPEDLRKTVQTCFQTKDTNLFWKLHSWNNVSPAEQNLHKSLMSSLFMEMPGEKATYSSFQVRPAHPKANEPVKLKKGGLLKSNIPITGVITFKAKSKSMNIEEGLPFGRGADGNYWFTVSIKVPDPKQK